MKGKHRGAEEKEQIVRAYAERTVSSEEFCRKHHVSLASILKWRKQQSPPAGFSELMVHHESDHGYRIRVPGGELCIPANYSLASVRELLRVMGEL